MEAKGASTTTTTAGDAKADATSTETKVAATTADTKASAGSMLDGEGKAETKQAADETKVETTETKDAKAETKASELVDEKWEPPAVEGVTRDAKVTADVRALFVKHKVPTALAKELFEYADKQAIEADPELGGAKLETETKPAFHRAIRALGGQPLADALRNAGIENDMAVVKAFVKAGRSIAEDTVKDTVKDGGKAVGDPFERQLRSTYPTMFKE